MTGGKTYSYTYDSNGIRTAKTVDGVEHSYTYASSKLLRETFGSNTLDFFYDNAGYPYAVKYNGTLYYYITNLQGDVLHLVNTSGTTVVSYEYDPYGKLLNTTGSMATTLGAANPLRYRGYYYDTETGFYYLQSRYYDPTIGRFVIADNYTSTGQGVTGNNMFAYCLNCPVSFYDRCGHDAIWIQESNSAKGCGHSGLLVQDEATKKWYYFYWGPVDEGENPVLLATYGVPCNCVLVEVTVNDEDLLSVDGVRNILGSCNNAFVKNRVGLVTDIYYFEGDYSNTLEYLRRLEQDASTYGLTYHLLLNNCVQKTWYALGLSDVRLLIESCPVVPDLAYTKMLSMNGEFWKSVTFSKREISKVFIK